MPKNKKFLWVALPILAVTVLCYFQYRPDPTYQGKAMSQWLHELENDSAGTESATCRALCGAGSVAVPSLLAGLQQRDDSSFYSTLWTHLPAFIRGRLSHPAKHQNLRLRCAFVLGQVEPATPEIVRALRRSLSTDDVYQITFAAQALRMISERETGLTQELEKALPDLRSVIASGRDERGQVARALTSIESHTKRKTL